MNMYHFALTKISPTFSHLKIDFKLTIFILGSSLSVDKWLSEVDGQTFEDWQKRSIRIVTKRPEWKKSEAKTVFLQEKYFKKWYDKTLRRQASLSFDMTSSSSW